MVKQSPWAMFKAASIISYIVMVGSLLALLAMRAVFSISPFVMAVQAASFLLFLWARITFGWRSFHAAANPTAGGLVTSGPYRYIRHPIYTALCAFAWAGIGAHWSWKTCLCGVLMLAGAWARMSAEETLIVRRYPEYSAYAKNTWRMIPYLY